MVAGRSSTFAKRPGRLRRVTTIQGTPQADLAVTEAGPAGGVPGTNVSYTLTATNNGPDSAANVSLTDTLPAGVTFVSIGHGGR